MISETFVNYAFRLINLAVLVGLASYIFKTKVRGSLEEAAAEEESYLTGLKQQSSALLMKIDEQHKQQHELEKQTNVLKHKLQLWNQSYQQEQAAAQLQQEKVAFNITQLNQKKLEYIATMRLTQATVGPAIKQAAQELTKRYASPAESADYLAKLVSYLKENTHE